MSVKKIIKFENFEITKANVYFKKTNLSCIKLTPN